MKGIVASGYDTSSRDSEKWDPYWFGSTVTINNSTPLPSTQMKSCYDYEFIRMLKVFDKVPKLFGRLGEYRFL